MYKFKTLGRLAVSIAAGCCSGGLWLGRASDNGQYMGRTHLGLMYDLRNWFVGLGTTTTLMSHLGGTPPGLHLTNVALRIGLGPLTVQFTVYDRQLQARAA